jgi:hypothetical protein
VGKEGFRENETLEDLRTLVDGFLELSRATGSQASPAIEISSAAMKDGVPVRYVKAVVVNAQ